MPSTQPYSTVNMPEVMTRNTAAREIVAGFATATPALSALWQQITTALADTARLASEIARLSAELKAARLDRANLLAAIRATLSAQADGEADPLSYLRDELHAAQNASHSRAGGTGG